MNCQPEIDIPAWIAWGVMAMCFVILVIEAIRDRKDFGE